MKTYLVWEKICSILFVWKWKETGLWVFKIISDGFFYLNGSRITSSLSWTWSSVKELLLICGFIGVVFSACPQSGKYCLEWRKNIVPRELTLVIWGRKLVFLFLCDFCIVCVWVVCVYLHTHMHTYTLIMNFLFTFVKTCRLWYCLLIVDAPFLSPLG